MFIYNVKINGNKLFKILLVCMLLVVTFIFGLTIYKIFIKNNVFSVSDNPHSEITTIEPHNYTNILKASHEHIDDYIGKEIKFSGYIYKVYDFNDHQFVLARDMLINNQSYVVGFLCDCDSLSKFEDNSWIEVTGKITKGKYHNQDIPIVKIKSITKAEKPENPFVSPPSNTYIPTSSML